MQDRFLCSGTQSLKQGNLESLKLKPATFTATLQGNQSDMGHLELSRETHEISTGALTRIQSHSIGVPWFG